MNQNSRSIVSFTMVSHAIVHTYELSIPILVVIWLSEFSITTAAIGTVVAVGYALFGVGALPSGVLADRYSTKRLVLVGLAGMGASFLLLSLAPGTATIALALALWGAFASIHHPASLSLISTGVDESGTGFAYHGMAGNLGIAFGPFLTASLLVAFDWRVVAALLVVPAAVAVAYALSAEFDEMAAVDVDDTDDAGDTATNADGTDRGLLGFLADTRALFTVGFTLVLAVVVTNGLFYRGTLTFLPDVLGGFVADVPGPFDRIAPDSALAAEFDLASYLYAGLLTVGIAGQYTGGKLTDRIPVVAGLAAVFTALVALAVAFVPVASQGLVPLVAISAVFGFVLFSIQPLYQAAIAAYSPPDGRGLSYAGYLLGMTTVSQAFFLLALVPATGAVLAVVLYAVVGEGTRSG
jgi:MFS family permease